MYLRLARIFLERYHLQIAAGLAVLIGGTLLAELYLRYWDPLSPLAYLLRNGLTALALWVTGVIWYVSRFSNQR